MQIFFNKKFYDLEAIKTAIVAFSDLAEFTLNKDLQGIEVKIKNIEPEVKEVIGGEFANFVLAQMKK